MVPIMNTRMGRVPAVLIVSGMSVGLVASGISAASAASQPTPRVSSSKCASLAATQSAGYTVNDEKSNGTKCVIKKNGTWQWTKAKGSKRVAVKTSFRVLRGDVRSYATYRFVKGSKVIVKRVKIKSGKQANVSVKLPKKGKWAVTATYRGAVVSSVMSVR